MAEKDSNSPKEVKDGLWQRYAAAFTHAWSQRKNMAPVQRLPHEAEFLPAALALRDAPAPAAPRVTLWAIIVFVVAVVAWSWFGRIDVVSTAQGRIIPDQHTKTIQPIETATVKRILVRDGQTVHAGEPLIELDATAADAEREQVDVALAGATLQAARATAMLDVTAGKSRVSLQAPKEADAALVAEARRLLEGQRAEFEAGLSRIDAEMSRREAELRSTRELVNKLQQTAPIARQREQDFQTLVDEKFVSRHSFLDRQQVRIEQEADLANQRSRLTEIQASLREAGGQRKEFIAQTRRTALDSLTEAQQRMATLEQDRKRTAQRSRLLTLHAPVDGTVQQLAVHTVGGVVTPAQVLMMLVPGNNPLEVEAFLENRDIGFVRPGQKAEVKVETFQYTRYGTIPAQVESVSHDAIQDEKLGLVYSTRVRLSKSSVNVDGADVSLGPGMAVTVEIKTGKRRLMEYFLSPLIQHASESLRER